MINKMPSTGAPAISVVITSYNYGAFLPRAIESVIGQDVAGLEVVIVDNCSTDDSWDIIRRYAARDGRIRPFQNERNLGLVGNHVRGLELARGERVLFLSADDYLLPGHLARALAVHHQHPDVDIVVTTYFQVDEYDRITRYLNHIGHLRGTYVGGRNEFAGLLTYDCYTCLPTTLFDREDLLASGGFDPNLLACDLDIYLRFAANGKKFAFLDTPGACIRVHSESASGRDKYVATGKQFLEHVYLLERYLTPHYEHLVRGHESGVARLLQAKINNLRAYPTAHEILPQNQHRVDAIVARLNELLSRTLGAPLPAQPLISVILRVDDDINAYTEFARQLEAQTYKNIELVLSVDANCDVMPMLLDRSPFPTKLVNHRLPQSRAISLNDAARLAGGEVIVYGDVHVGWPVSHLARVVRALSDSRIDAVTVPVDLVITRDSKDVATYRNFSGGILAEASARIGEAVPLYSLAHRRRVLDIAGPFEEGLAHLVDFEFLQRLLSRGPLGVDDTDALTQRAGYDSIHPALSDPNGYVGSLRAIYQGRLVDAAMAEKREAHFARLTNELRTLGLLPDTTRAHLFSSIVRGSAPIPTLPKRSRKRVLVIDDCVPYNELGRGYPRARSVVEDLRDEGYDVVFYPLVRPFDDMALSYGIDGITVLYGQGPELLGLTLDAELDSIDLLWVSRPHNMRDVQSILRAIGRPTPPIIYDAEAVYVERDRVRAILEGRPLTPERYQEALAKELSYTEGCAIVSAVSEGERELISHVFTGPIEVLSFSIDAAPTMTSFEERDGILFVGAIEENSPNDDALFFFASSVAPMLPTISLRHAGVMNSWRLRNTAVEFLGIVPDLRPIYNASRIFIAPTRFAAGLPQKVYEAAAHGLPVIASSLIASQLGWNAESDLLVADTPEEWKAAVERLNVDNVLWNSLREAGLRRVRNEVSPAAFRSRVASIARCALASIQTQVHV